MQKFVLKLAGLSFLVATFFFTSCGDDPVVVDPLRPDISLLSEIGFFATDSELDITEQSFSVRVNLQPGDAQLNGLEIFVGNTTDRLPLDRFTVNGGAILSNNPLGINGADVDGVTYDIEITRSGTEAIGEVTIYTFTVSDKDGQTATTDIAITTTGFVGTPIENNLTGVLLNQAGPSGTGGLDLDTGQGTGSSDAAAEIRDLGIDCTIPTTQENWRSLFGTVNGATMVKVDESAVEGFDYDNVTTIETITDIFNNASIALDNGESQSPSCVSTQVTDVSGPVAVGDVFIVFANDTYYMIRVDEINFILEDDPSTNDTFENNQDNFVFSVKF